MHYESQELVIKAENDWRDGQPQVAMQLPFHFNFTYVQLRPRRRWKDTKPRFKWNWFDMGRKKRNSFVSTEKIGVDTG